jgi:hypothetical protein
LIPKKGPQLSRVRREFDAGSQIRGGSLVIGIEERGSACDGGAIGCVSNVDISTMLVEDRAGRKSMMRHSDAKKVRILQS